MHQLQRLSIHPNWCVIDRRTADLEQFTPTRQAQLCVLFMDHFAAFPLSSILRIDCRAMDGLIALAPVTKNHSPPPVGRSWREVLRSRRPYSRPF